MSNISFSVVIQAFFIVSPHMVVKPSQINGWELLLPESFTSCTLRCLTLIKTFVELLQVWIFFFSLFVDILSVKFLQTVNVVNNQFEWFRQDSKRLYDSRRFDQFIKTNQLKWMIYSRIGNHLVLNIWRKYGVMRTSQKKKILIEFTFFF